MQPFVVFVRLVAMIFFLFLLHFWFPHQFLFCVSVLWENDTRTKRFLQVVPCELV